MELGVYSLSLEKIELSDISHNRKSLLENYVIKLQMAGLCTVCEKSMEVIHSTGNT